MFFIIQLDDHGTLLDNVTQLVGALGFGVDHQLVFAICFGFHFHRFGRFGCSCRGGRSRTSRFPTSASQTGVVVSEEELIRCSLQRSRCKANKITPIYFMDLLIIAFCFMFCVRVCFNKLTGK